MTPKNRILFPTEFGPLGEKAETNAAFFAKKTGVVIELLNVVLPSTGSEDNLTKLNETKKRRASQEKLNELGSKLGAGNEINVACQTRMSTQPEKAIVEAAADIDASLIIFGTKGGSGLRDTLLGSAVNYVIRNSSCPVFSIRESSDKPGFERILVPLDTANDTNKQVRWAVKLGQVYGAEIHFFTIVDKTIEDMAKMEGKLRNAQKAARDGGLTNIHTTFRSGTSKNAADQILEFSQEIKADLICILTQRDADTGFFKPLLGSVADKVVNKSPKAVFSIPPKSKMMV